MINLYYSRSDKDRIRFIFDKAAQYRADGKKSAFIIVPDQHTLEMERRAFECTGKNSVMNIEIYSFSRLAAVLNSQRVTDRIYLDDLGQNMLLRRIISGMEDKLGIFAAVSGGGEFVRMTGKLIQEFKKFGTSPERLREIIEEAEKKTPDIMILKKLKDVSLIYEAYEAETDGKYFDSEDYMTQLCEAIGRSDMFRDSAVFVTGFDILTGKLISIMEAMALSSGELNVAVSYAPEGSRDYRLFAPVETTFDGIRQIAENTGQEFGCFEIGDEYARAQNRELLTLCRELHSYPVEKCEDSPESIRVISCENMETELEWAAGEIIRLVNEEGLRFNDIFIAANDIALRRPALKRVFERYGICFFDGTRNAGINNKYMQFLLALCDIGENGCSVESLMNLAWSGMVDITEDEAEIIENYGRAYSVEGWMWLLDFRRLNTRGLLPEEADAKLAELNDIRRRLTAPAEQLLGVLDSRKSGGELAEGFFEFLQKDMQMDSHIQRESDRLKEEGYLEHSAVTVQLWNRTVSLLGQLSGILGDYECGGAEFCQILRAGIESIEIGTIPTTADQVMIGDYRNSGMNGCGVLFAMGFNDGVVPVSSGNAGILSDREKDRLNNMAGELCIGGSRDREQERLEIYKTLSLPEEKLYISYCSKGEGDADAAPSGLLNRIKGVYPNLETEMLNAESTSAGWAAYRSRISYYREHPENDRRLRYIDLGEDFRNRRESLSRDEFVQLYSEQPVASSTSLEQYSRCPFAHFIKYGLRADEGGIFEVSRSELGSIFHDVMMKFSEYVTGNALWSVADMDKCEELVGHIAEEAVAASNNSFLFEGAEGRYRIGRIKNVCTKTAFMAAEHINKGHFEEFLFETPFKNGGILPSLDISGQNGLGVRIEGRIDRIDIAHAENGDLLKIIDYKSGQYEVEVDEIRAGYRLQLMVYMLAAEAGLKKKYVNLSPAGVFYFQIAESEQQPDEKKLAKGLSIDEIVEEQFRRSFQMKGLIVDEPEVLDSLDDGFEGASEVIHVKRKKDGTVGKSGTSGLMSRAEFDGLLNVSRDNLSKLCGGLTAGDVSIEPVKDGDVDACRHCGYKSICCFNPELPGFRYRR